MAGGVIAIIIGLVLTCAAIGMLQLAYAFACYDPLTGDVCVGADWTGQSLTSFLWLLLAVGITLVILGITSLRKR